MPVVKGNEYLGFQPFLLAYEKYKELGDYANKKGYLVDENVY